jgi:protocatechuate 3,4-dioxygenase beta subunit
MLRATNRHPWRPAHIHFVISAGGYETVTTHIFDSTDAYLDSDTVFGVKESLIQDFVQHDTPNEMSRRFGVEPPFCTATFDFVLKPVQ